jgi:hypothetical protein
MEPQNVYEVKDLNQCIPMQWSLLIAANLLGGL